MNPYGNDARITLGKLLGQGHALFLLIYVGSTQLECQAKLISSNTFSRNNSGMQAGLSA